MEKKSFWSKIGDWTGAFFKVITPLSIITAAIFFGEFNTTFKATMESNKQMETQFKAFPSAEQLDRFIEHMNNKFTHPLRISADSIYFTRQEAEEWIKGAAIDAYNTKRVQDQILEAQQENKKAIIVLGYKIDRINN